MAFYSVVAMEKKSADEKVVRWDFSAAVLTVALKVVLMAVSKVAWMACVMAFERV